MFRKLMSWLLKADLNPAFQWSETEASQVVARTTVMVPRFLSKPESLEQVLCALDRQYLLFMRWSRSGQMSKAVFSQTLDGRQMRIVEMQPAPEAMYRLQLWPADGASVTCSFARRTWFGLWRNEPPMELGASVCFLDSTDRQQLKDLRSKLLDGNIPEALRNEEEMWERMNSLSEQERRAAYANLAMRQFAELDRRFEETFPDVGPPPDELKPALDGLQDRIRQIQQVAQNKPVDSELAEMMRRFITDASNQVPPNLKPRPGLDSQQRDP